MRILQVIRSVDPSYGGPLAGVCETARELNRRGHTVHILTLDGPRSRAIQQIDTTLFAAGPSYLSYGYAPRLKPWLRANASHYDAIILNGIWEYSSVGSWRALRKTSVPYFLYTHGMLDPWFQTRRLSHFKKTAYWKLWEHRVLRDAAAVLFTAEEERRLAPASFSPYRCEQRVVSYGTASPPQGADTQAAKFYTRFPELRERRVVLFLGRLHPKKGCDLLLRAFAELKHRDPRLHLVMAGPGEPRFVHKLRRLAHQLTIADRTTWTGGLFGDLKWGALRSADLFVLPSHTENFGVAVVEALACGLPVAISNKVNIWREIQQDGVGFTGNDDAAGAAGMLREWLDNSPEQIASMRNRARRTFAGRYDIRRTSDLLVRTLISCGVQDRQPAHPAA